MFPPVFETAVASPDVIAWLGVGPTRLFLFGEATQKTQKPYAVWQVVGGSPENYLANPPNVDHWVTQIDVYAETSDDVRAVAEALRDAFQAVAYVTGWRGESRSPETTLYRYSFDVEWWKNR